MKSKKIGLAFIIWLIVALAMILLQNIDIFWMIFGLVIASVVLVAFQPKKFITALIIGIIILVLLNAIIPLKHTNSIVIVETPNQITVNENSLTTCPLFYNLTYVDKEIDYNMTYGIETQRDRKMVWDIKMKLKRFADKKFILNVVKEYGIIGWQKKLYSSIKNTVEKTINKEMHPQNHLPLDFEFKLSNNKSFEIRKLGYKVVGIKAKNGRLLK